MKKILFLLVLLFGMFLMPDNAMACGGSSKKQSCTKEMTSSKKEHKSCCGENNSKEEGDKGCKGKCGHSKCTCASSCSTTPIHLCSDVIFQNNAYRFSVIEKAPFCLVSSSISAGFYSIWLIPKIG